MVRYKFYSHYIWLHILTDKNMYLLVMVVLVNIICITYVLIIYVKYVYTENCIYYKYNCCYAH